MNFEVGWVHSDFEKAGTFLRAQAPFVAALLRTDLTPIIFFPMIYCTPPFMDIVPGCTG